MVTRSSLLLFDAVPKRNGVFHDGFGVMPFPCIVKDSIISFQLVCLAGVWYLLTIAAPFELRCLVQLFVTHFFPVARTRFLFACSVELCAPTSIFGCFKTVTSMTSRIIRN